MQTKGKKAKMVDYTVHSGIRNLIRPNLPVYPRTLFNYQNLKSSPRTKAEKCPIQVTKEIKTVTVRNARDLANQLLHDQQKVEKNHDIFIRKTPSKCRVFEKF